MGFFGELIISFIACLEGMSMIFIEDFRSSRLRWVGMMETIP